MLDGTLLLTIVFVTASEPGLHFSVLVTVTAFWPLDFIVMDG